MFFLAAACLLPAALTALLPRRLLLVWLPLLGAATLWLLGSLEEGDGPGHFFAVAFAGFFVLTNGPVVIGRLMFVAGSLRTDLTRGYGE